MKFLLTIWMVMLASMFSFGGDYTIQNGNIDGAQRTATKSGKPILVNFSTTWCPGCKTFDREYNSNQELRDFIAEQTEYIKIDCESEYGKPLAAKYKVAGYPSFVMIDPSDMSAVHVFMGYRDNEYFTKNILDGKKPLPTIESLRSFQGDMSFDQYCAYQRLASKLLQDAEMQDAEFVLSRVWALDKDNANKELYKKHPNYDRENVHFYFALAWRFMSLHFTGQDIDHSNFTRVANLCLEMIDLLIPGDQASFLYNYLSVANKLDLKVDAKKLVDLGLKATSVPTGHSLKDITAENPEYILGRLEHQHMWYRKGFVVNRMITNDLPDVAVAYVKFFMGDNYDKTSRNLNELAWFIFENAEKMPPDYITAGIEYAEKGVNLAEQDLIDEKSGASRSLAAVLDTLAELYHFVGRREDAIRVCSRAIEVEPNDNFFKEQLEKFSKN